MQMILEDQNRENAERIRKLEAEIERLRIEGREKDLLIKHWQDKAATLIRECLSLEVDLEERNWKIRELQDWRKVRSIYEFTCTISAEYRSYDVHSFRRSKTSALLPSRASN